jgi:hypothetical protein
VKVSLLFFSRTIILAILGIVVTIPSLVSAGTIQNSLECKRKTEPPPQNIDAQIDWLERRLACWKKQQRNESDEKISQVPAPTQPRQSRTHESDEKISQVPAPAQPRQGSLNEDFELGLQYYLGRSVPKDYSKAKKFLDRGADAGHVESQSLLGTLYYYGRGVFRDYDIAFGWFRLAALQGDLKARKKIAYMYEHGLGVSQDSEKSAYWYKLSDAIHPTDALQTSLPSMKPIESVSQPDSTSTPKLAHKKELPLEALHSKKEAASPQNREFTIGYSLAYRYDQLDWNISGALNNCCPNVLTEYSWNDLHIGQLVIDTTGRLNRFYYRGRFGYGAILDGNLTNMSHGGQDRSLTNTKIRANADKGYVLDGKVGVGFSWYQLGGIEIVSMVGYNYSKQKLTMLEPAIYQIGTGSLSGLDSTYSARWMGPWMGLDLLMKKSRNWNIALGFEYHLAAYYAEANLNLRHDYQHPISFEHWNNGIAGRGILGYLDVRYQFSPQWSGIFMTEYQDWYADGTDRTHIVGGSAIDVSLNEVNWLSFTTRFGVHYAF